MTYQEFIQSKKPLAQLNGFKPKSLPHPSLKGHQADIALWMATGGRRACFMAFGLGKTRTHIQVAVWICEKDPRKYLIICPLGVRYVFMKEEGPAMGVQMTYCTTDAEVDAAPTQIVITNRASGMILSGCGRSTATRSATALTSTFAPFSWISLNGSSPATATPGRS